MSFGSPSLMLRFSAEMRDEFLDASTPVEVVVTSHCEGGNTEKPAVPCLNVFWAEEVPTVAKNKIQQRIKSLILLQVARVLVIVTTLAVC